MSRKNHCGILKPVLALMFFMFSVTVFGQKLNFSISGGTLESLLQEVTKQSGYVFAYTDAINAQMPASAIAENEDAPAFFKRFFAQVGIAYKIEGKQVFLTPVEIAPVENSEIEIKGLVTDENKESIPGVSIQNMTTKKGVYSDIDGKFSIRAKVGDVLRFSSIGMVSLDLKVQNNKSYYDVVMKSDMVALEDVVVTGYQTISKERATGSFNIVGVEQLNKPSTDLSSRLVGVAAGVQATMNSDGEYEFEIRGQSSLNAVASPLVVVDGFAIEGGLSSLNPNDIESISILKDAAAASIWGAKSSNGVIVVTSKGAKADKGVKVEFNSFWKFSSKMDLEYARNLASSSEIIEYETKGFNTNLFGGPWPLYENSNQDLTGAYSRAVEAMNEHRLGFLSEAEMNSILDKLRKTDNTDQIRDYLLDNPFSQQYNLSIYGNSEKMRNVLSLMYENGNGKGQNGNVQGNTNNKYMVNYRTNVNVFKWLDFYFNGAVSYEELRYNGDNSWQSLSRYDDIVDENGNPVPVNYMYYMPNIERWVPYKDFPYSDWTYNPILERQGRNKKTTTLNLRAQAGLTFKIINGLDFDSKFQYEVYQINTKDIYDESTFTVRNMVNTYTSWDMETNELKPNLPKGGFLEQSKSEVNSYNWRNQLNFNREFADRHNISFIVGTEISNRVAQGMSSPRTYGYNDEKLTVGTFPNGVGGSGALKLTNWQGWTVTLPYTHSYSYSTDRYFSMYANLSYTFDRKYTVSASARTDASNLITDDPKYRFAPFWSVGASWNLGAEDFMKDIVWIDRLLVRATYGSNGNVDKSTSFQPLISVGGTQNQYIQDFTASISSFGNPNLRWERTNTIDVGVDFDFLGGALSGKVDFYNKKGKDLIVSMSIPAVNGTKTQKLNMAEMTNRGFEKELGSTQKILGNDIVWYGSVNFSYNHNNIDKLFKTTYNAYDLYGGGTAAYVQGHDANSLWAFQYAGVDKDGNPMVKGVGDETYYFTGWTPGDGRDYMLDMGTKVAPMAMGFSSTFKIYDFDLSFMITGKFGHVFNGAIFNYDAMTGGAALPNSLYSEVANGDPMKVVPIPEVEERYYFWDRFYPYLDYRVQNASHIRFQELNVSYNLPARIAKIIGIGSAKIYAQANNLFTINFNKYNEDPEYPLGTIKPVAGFTFGLNLTF